MNLLRNFQIALDGLVRNFARNLAAVSLTKHCALLVISLDRSFVLIVCGFVSCLFGIEICSHALDFILISSDCRSSLRNFLFLVLAVQGLTAVKDLGHLEVQVCNLFIVFLLFCRRDLVLFFFRRLQLLYFLIGFSTKLEL